MLVIGIIVCLMALFLWTTRRQPPALEPVESSGPPVEVEEPDQGAEVPPADRAIHAPPCMQSVTVPPDDLETGEPQERYFENIGEETCSNLVAAALRSVPTGEQKTLSPYFFVPTGGGVEDLPLKSTRADVQIAGVMADVTVTQEYRNEGEGAIEAVYLFPASTRAAVHALKMTIGTRVVEAQIREREQAKQEYEKAVAKGKTASLLTQQRPNVFQMVVGNILPGDEIRVELTYAELLVPTDRQYEFVYPTVVGPRYSNISVEEASEEDQWVAAPYMHEAVEPTYTFGLDATLNSGVAIAKVDCPSHEVAVNFEGPRTAQVHLAEGKGEGNRDFVLRYRLAGDRIQSGLMLYPGEKENFFLLMMEPPERVTEAQIVPREYLFIVDVSGSMGGFPLDVSKELMGDLLGSLRPEDHFNVLLFAGGSALLADRSMPATPGNIATAMTLVDQQRGGGGTELLPALQRALALPTTDGMSRIVVVATDGYVTVEDEAYELVRQMPGKANLFSFGIGSAVNRHLVEMLARAGQGEPVVVLDQEEAADKAASFRKQISSPLLQGIDVQFDGFDAYDVQSSRWPDLFADRPLVMFGKYKGAATGNVVITGKVPGADYRKVIPAHRGVASDKNQALQYLWARDRIHQLDEVRDHERYPDRAAEITRIGLDYGLLTEYTSFIAVDKVKRIVADPRRVKQPLPMPQGVPDSAVGGVCRAAGSSGRGSGGFGQGLGSLGTKGRGRGASGYGSGGGYFGKKSSGTPGMVTGDAIILGALSRDDIDRVVKAHLAQIRYCYQKELQKNPELAGKVVIKFVIAPDGSVSSAKVQSTTLNNVIVENCICQRFLRFTFDETKGGGIVIVTYPFVFNSV